MTAQQATRQPATLSGPTWPPGGSQYDMRSVLFLAACGPKQTEPVDRRAAVLREANRKGSLGMVPA